MNEHSTALRNEHSAVPIRDDIVYIRALQVETVIGVHEHERQQPQSLLVDLEMAADIRAAAANDDLSNALDYDAVARRISSFVASTHYHLLETLAERIADMLLQEFPISHLRLRLGKPSALANAAEAGVIIERGKSSPA